MSEEKNCLHVLDIFKDYARCLVCFSVWYKWRKEEKTFIQRIV